jgi:amidase
VTLEELREAAATCGFLIPPKSRDEESFLLYQNSFDFVAKGIADLPEYVDPRLLPTPTTAERNCMRTAANDNPLNAWSHKVSFCRVMGVFFY